MKHIQILKSASKDCILDFSHFNMDASAGAWKKENVIMRNCIKINVFIEGKFSIFTDEVLHHPTYGDICVLPPMKMHYGQITEATHINYYQLDVSRNAFSGIPDGERMIDRLLAVMEKKNSFLRPDPESRELIFKLFGEMETAIAKEEPFLAYAKAVEFLAMLPSLYLQPTKKTGNYSFRIAQIIKYIEANYAEKISVKKISDELGVSESFLSRIFKKELGVTIHEYLNQYRTAKAISLLQTGSVTEVGYACGFCDTSHFISIFKKYTGSTPMQYKKQQY